MSGVVFFAFSFILLAILPGARLQQAMDHDAPINMVNYRPIEARGRSIYARQGCDYCHTEQVRGTLADVRRWGPATEPWETRYDYPQVWGTRRIGPDLSREGGVRSDDWQLTHLYNPRWVVPGSVMPSYPWMFDGDANHPNEDGRAVLAYMQTLGRSMREAHDSTAYCPKPQPKVVKADLESKTPLIIEASVKPGAPRSAAPTRSAAPSQSFEVGPIYFQDGMAMGGSIDANAAIRRLDTPFPDLANGDPTHDLAARQAAGAKTFITYCSGCHGANGAGDGPAAPTLLPHPANLGLEAYSDSALGNLLWNGRPGTSMPAWRDLSKTEFADVIAYVQSLHVADPAASPPQSAETIARGATVYAKDCVACHGVDGGGNGPVAHVFLPRPANLNEIQPDQAKVLQVLAEGVPGASMPIFNGLSPLDQSAVAAYVATLYGSQKPKRP
jgi:cytochrome c oxidase cbb3-type subunit II